MLAGYLPFHLWGTGAGGGGGCFSAGSFRCWRVPLGLVNCCFGVTMPAPVLGVSLGLFAVSAVLEGAITLAIMQALVSINPISSASRN